MQNVKTWIQVGNLCALIGALALPSALARQVPAVSKANGAGPTSWAPPDLNAALTADSALTDAAQLKSRFAVPSEVAETLATNYARKFGPDEREPRIAFSIPFEDPIHGRLATCFILSRNSAVTSLPALLEEGERLFSLTLENSSPATGGADEFAEDQIFRMNKLAALDFYTIVVTAYSYHAPILLAYQGLPRWILEPQPVKTQCPSGELQLVRVFPLGNRSESHEVVEYTCAGRKIYFDHFGRRVFKGPVPSVHDPVTDYSDWQRRNLRAGMEAAKAQIDAIQAAWDALLRSDAQPQGVQR